MSHKSSGSFSWVAVSSRCTHRTAYPFSRHAKIRPRSQRISMRAMYGLCRRRGTFEDLRKLEEALCEALGLGRKKSFKHFSYRELALKYKTRELTSMHETKMEEDYGRVVFIERFPEFSSPFWNMRRIGTSANKIDVIIDGMETIGSAERSSNVGEMRERFHSISGGGYAALLYKKFGKRRVIRELEEFLSLTFFPRCGGGIGMTRLMKACTLGE